MKKSFFLSLAIIFVSSVLFITFHKKQPISNNKEDTIYFITGYFKNIFGDNRNGFFNLAKALEEKGYKVIDTNNTYANFKNAKNIIVFDIHKKKLNRIKKLPKDKLILFAWEPPCVITMNHDKKYHKLFSKVYTTNDDLIDNKTTFKFYYPVLKQMAENDLPFENRKLCCNISADKSSIHKSEIYSERRKAIRFFETSPGDEFDLYGRGWKKEEFKSYQGEINNKLSCLKKYKFCICYENSQGINGYITEKIFDSFEAGCVPIYLGADNITDYIPENCFIDKRKFKTYEELLTFLRSMTKEDYENYICNIKSFLISSKAKLFTGENLVKTIVDAIESNPEKL
ncbi:MAG: glycosyltransferase family 10 [Parachlamydiales bacterium]|jgi:hypothetical protein